MSTWRLAKLRGVQPPGVGSCSWRLVSLRATGTPAVVVLVDLTGKTDVEGNELVTLQAAVAGATAYTLTYVQTAGPAVTPTITGNKLTYVAPAHMNAGPVTITWRVTVTAAGSSDVVDYASQTVWPCPVRHLTASGWQPVTEWMNY